MSTGIMTINTADNRAKSGKIWRLAITVLALAGFALIANGIWIKAKAELAQVLLERAFTKTVAGDANAKPWPWADIKPIARMTVERLNKQAVILDNASGEALAFGPAHLKETPLPGEEGTSIISGHRDTHFSWLRYLENGDDIKIRNAKGVEMQFKVTGSRIARFDEANININSFGRKLALTTCYPFDAKTRGPLRYVVEAEMIN